VGVIGCLRRRADPVRVLSVLALLSTVVVYHRDYDLIVLLVPLVAVLFGHERDRVLGALFLGAIGMSWYVDKVMYTLYPTPQDPRLPPFLAPYYWAEVVVWYATLFYGLWLLHRPERVPEPAPAR